MTEQQLLQLKKDTEQAKIKVSELTGEQTALMKQLKKEFDCDSLEQAINKLQNLSKRKEKYIFKIQEAINGLKGKYNLE
jgi:DNA repair ATPase RecN